MSERGNYGMRYECVRERDRDGDKEWRVDTHSGPWTCRNPSFKCGCFSLFSFLLDSYNILERVRMQ